MPARNHHFVPQAYLRGFSKPGRRRQDQVFVVDRVSGRSFPSNVRNIAASRDFNRVDIPEQPSDALEAAYGAFESEAADALTRIRESKSFDSHSEDGMTILNLIAILAVRNPRIRRNFAGFQAGVAKQILNLALASKDRWESHLRRARAAGFMENTKEVSYEEIKRFHQGSGYTIETTTTAHATLETQVHDTVLQLLGQRTWVAVTADRNAGEFITSDHPVALYFISGRRGPVGFGLPDTEVLFPISRDMIILGRFGAPAPAPEKADLLFVALTNGALASFCDRQVYASGPDFKVIMGEAFIDGAELAGHAAFRRASEDQDEVHVAL